jgi:hypothetical protein
MKRLPNWRMPLAELFRQAQTQTFAWGSFDCALFACDCVWVQTGKDPAAAFRGTYSTEAEANALGSLSAIAETVAAQFGLAEIAPGHAGRGDIVLIQNQTAQGALAVVDFSGAYAVCPGSRGLIRVRRHRWQRAWRV